MVKVSVIIPVYNVEDYLGECLDSVLNQTLQDIEVVCVNDGSTDKSLQVLQTYAEKDNRIKIITQPNQGLSVTRNTGLENASGKYVYFMDSDDYIESNSLEVCYTHSEEKNLDVLFFGGDVFYDSEELELQRQDFKGRYFRNGTYNEVLNGKKLLHELRKNGDYIVSACFSFTKTKFLKENNITFMPKVLHEDNLYTFTLLLKSERTFCINDVFFRRRIRQDSIMTRKESHRNLYGYYKCFLGQYEIACETLDNLENSVEVEKQQIKNDISGVIDSLIFQINRLYNQIDETEKQKFVDELNSQEKHLFELIIVKFINRINAEKWYAQNRITELEGTITSIENSLSYKTGRILTLIPRKLRTVVKILKNKGIKGIITVLASKIKK